MQKGELMLKEFGINYYNEPDLFRKGTTLIRKLIPSPTDGKLRQYIISLYCDLIGEEFWKEHPEIVGLKSLQVYHKTIQNTIFMVTKPCDKIDNESNSKMESNHWTLFMQLLSFSVLIFFFYIRLVYYFVSFITFSLFHMKFFLIFILRKK